MVATTDTVNTYPPELETVRDDDDDDLGCGLSTKCLIVRVG